MFFMECCYLISAQIPIHHEQVQCKWINYSSKFQYKTYASLINIHAVVVGTLLTVLHTSFVRNDGNLRLWKTVLKLKHTAYMGIHGMVWLENKIRIKNWQRKQMKHRKENRSINKEMDNV